MKPKRDALGTAASVQDWMLLEEGRVDQVGPIHFNCSRRFCNSCVPQTWVVVVEPGEELVRGIEDALLSSLTTLGWYLCPSPFRGTLQEPKIVHQRSLQMSHRSAASRSRQYRQWRVACRQTVRMTMTKAGMHASAEGLMQQGYLRSSRDVQLVAWVPQQWPAMALADLQCRCRAVVPSRQGWMW